MIVMKLTHMMMMMCVCLMLVPEGMVNTTRIHTSYTSLLSGYT